VNCPYCSDIAGNTQIITIPLTQKYYYNCSYYFRVLSREIFGEILKTWIIILTMKIPAECGIQKQYLKTIV